MSWWLLALLAQTPSVETAGFTHPQRFEAPPAAACRECHPAVFASWEASAHHQSVTRPVFLDGYAVEPQARCLVCHAPAAVVYEGAVAARGAMLRGHLPLESPAREGIGCPVCHVRDGEVLTPHEAMPYGHPVREAPSLRSSDFCGECHEFSGHAVLDGRTVVNALPMQTTLSEWRAWGGAQRCQDCHMPAGSHRVRGPYELDFLRGALRLECAGPTARVTAIGVGHRVPTGDVFRHLVLWGDDEPLATFGLTLARVVDDAGVPGVAAVRDTRLEPEVPVTVRVPRGVRQVRLTYHFTGPSGRARVGLTREDELVEVAHCQPR